MALIACPDCGKEVSDAASVCIHCGRPMAAAPPPTYEPDAPPTYVPDAAPPPPAPAADRRTEPDLRAARAKRNATITYALHALSFFYGITGLVALVLGYVFRSDARGTWVESHFDWQISTFWWSVLGMIGVVMVTVALVAGGDPEASFAGAGVGTIGVFAVIGWIIYRVARGWIRLADDKPV